MATTAEQRETRIRYASPEEGRDLFDQQARALLGMSGLEFLERWDAGEFRDLADTPDGRRVMRLAMLLPFGRQDT